ncbi:putative copia-like polyprotein [Tanacetum coccineum]
MGPQRRLGIYVGYETISIIKYLEPLTGDVFTTRFAHFHFNKAIFPSHGEEKKNHEKDVLWSEPSFLYLDPHTKQNVNALARVEVPYVKSDDKVTQESKARLKRRRPIGSKDKKNMHLMDVFTAYLYGSLDSDIYMKIPKGFNMPEALSAKPKDIYSINLQRSLYGLKWSGRMWYNCLTVYVDDLNIIGANKETNEVMVHLKEECEMKDLGKTKYCLGLQIEHMPNGILVHQSNYTKKVLKRFSMDKAKSLSTPMVGRSLNVDNDPFCPCEEDEDVLGPEVPYLSAIEALMYLKNYTRPDISFAVNLLARFNAGYLFDPHKAISQTGYVFLNGGTAILWRSQKQTLIATSSNHAEVIALHKASRECVWLRSMTQLIVTSCGLNKEKSPTIIHEDNAACVAQMKEGYIKSDRTKHIPSRYFTYTQDLIKDNQIEMKYVKSSNNSADLFTKALPTSVFRNTSMLLACGMYKRHNTLRMSTSGGVNYTLHSFPSLKIFPTGFFFSKVFNEAVLQS